MPAPEILYLVATAGHPNYGDELIAKGWLTYLARRRPDAEVWLDCPQPGRAAVLLAGTHPHLHTTDTLWRVAMSHDGEDRAAAHGAARDRVTHLGTPREDLGIQLAARASSIHLIGGGHLVSRWPANLLLFSIASQFARDHGVPVHLTGAGLLPMDGPDVDLVRKALRDFTHADVRDLPSSDLFGLPLQPDDAFLALAQGAVDVDRRPSPDGMLLLQGDLHDRDAMTAGIDKALDVMRAAGLEGREIGVVEAIPPDDSWLLDAVRERWGAVRFYSFGEIWTEGLPVRASQVWVSTRFHLHLVAAAHGARGIAVNTGLDYYRIKHASLADRGTGWPIVEVDGAWPAPAVEPAFAANAKACGAERTRIADSIYAERGGRGLWSRKR